MEGMLSNTFIDFTGVKELFTRDLLYSSEEDEVANWF